MLPFKIFITVKHMPRGRKTRYNRSSNKRRARGRTGRSYTSRSRVPKSRGRKSYTKGHLFEDVVSRYFELLGYSVSKNVVKTGFSGARHEIDLLVEKDGVVGMVEAKNYSRPIPKEWVMKAYNVAKDIGANEVYVVSSSGFTEGAVKIAEVLNVRLLDLNDMVKEVRRKRELVKAKKGFLKPTYGRRKAEEYSLKFAIKRLFRCIEKPYNVKLLYIPVYLLSGVHKYYEEEGLIFKRYVERYREIKILVDGIRGSLILLDENTIEFIGIPRLSDNERMLLKIVMEYDKVSYSDLLEETGWSRQKLSRTLRSLLNKGVIDISDEEEEYMYYSLFPTIDDLDETASVLIGDRKPPIKDGLPTSGGEVLNVGIDISSLTPFLKNIYGLKVKDYQLIYLPLYRVTMRKIGEGTYRFIYLVAWIDEPIEVSIQL